MKRETRMRSNQAGLASVMSGICKCIRSIFIALVLLALLAMPQITQAVTNTWGLSSGGDWDTTTANWLDALSAPTTYTDGDAVLFDNTGGGNINIVGTVAPLTTTFSAASGTYAITNGVLDGTGSLTKDGAGTLQLYGLVPNPYSGGTIINDGTLHLGVVLSSGSPNVINPVGTGTVTLNNGRLYLSRVKASNALIVNGGTLYQQNGWGATWSGPVTLNTTLSCDTFYTLTISGDISGTGGLTKTLNGPLKLTGSNDYTGGTVINSGTITMNELDNSAMGSGLVTLNGGIIDMNRYYPTNSLVVNGGKLKSNNGWGNSWEGPVTLNADLTVDPLYNIVFNGIISGSGGLIIDRSNYNGAVTLAAANDYTGDTTVNNGTLKTNGNSIDDAGKLSMYSGKVEPTGTESVDTLYFGTLQQAGGTWGATGSGATHTNDMYFTGTAGVVNVITGVPMTDADILTFGLPGYPSVITGTNIAWTVPGTFDVSDLSPVYTISFGAIATPLSGTSRDFTTSQSYSVDSGDGTILNKIYVVTVTQAAVPSIFTWTNTVSGSWSDASKWSNNLATGIGPGTLGGSFYTLNLTAPNTYTTTHDLTDGFLLNQLNFGGVVTLDGLSGLALTADETFLPEINQNSSSTATIDVPIELAADTTVGGTGSGQVNIYEEISGTGSLTKDGAGGLWIETTTPNTYSGGTIINSGTLTLRFPTVSPVGSGPVALNGGTLYLWRVYPTNSLTANGGILLSSNGFGNDWKGPVALNIDLRVRAQYNMTFSGIISGPGGLLIEWGSVRTYEVRLTGTNDYTGDTTVKDSVLVVNGDSINDANTLIIDGGIVKPTGMETVYTLYLGTEKQEPGTYGATGSGAEYIDDVNFTGTAGVVQVVGAPRGTVIIIR